MIYNTTYTNPQTTFLINKSVGKPFPFIQRFKMGGIGSKRMDIIEFSMDLEAFKSNVADTQFGIVELRPKGILILINRQLQNFCWPISFTDLEFSGKVDLKIGTKTKYLIFKNGRLINTTFLKRIEQHQ